jgi:hypothetical protein
MIATAEIPTAHPCGSCSGQKSMIKNMETTKVIGSNIFPAFQIQLMFYRGASAPVFQARPALLVFFRKQVTIFLRLD